MRGRIGSGVAGWLAALAPLIIANLATYLGYLNFNEAVLAGTLGLVGSVLLGGVVAGILGGRNGGGARGSFASGGISAVLYTVSVIALNIIVSLSVSSSPQFLSNPIPACMAVLFCAALLLGVALIVGALVGTRSAPQRPRANQPPISRPTDRGTPPPYGSPAHPSQYLRPPVPRAAPPTIPRRDWQPYDDDPRAPYDRYDRDERQRTPGRRPADVMSRPSGYRQGAGRDDYDRYGDDRRG